MAESKLSKKLLTYHYLNRGFGRTLAGYSGSTSLSVFRLSSSPFVTAYLTSNSPLLMESV